MTAILAILQVVTANAIAPPVPLAPSATLATPTAAARALSVAALDPLPSIPVTNTLQCLVSDEGQLLDCIPANDGGTADIAVFRQRLFTRNEQSSADPALSAALARMSFYRVKPPRVASKAAASVLVREVVSIADKGPQDTALGTLAKGELKIDVDSAIDIASFYPPTALRAGAQTRVTATCRVLGDRSLLCRDPQVDLPPIDGEQPLWRVPKVDPDFARSTIRVFATMHAQPTTQSGQDSVGREIPLSLGWQLP